MAIRKEGGSNPYRGKVMTTMGYRAPRPPLCMSCGGRKEDQIYTISTNGQVICADCASPKDQGILKGCCNPDTCACGQVEPDEPDPAAA